jgi:alkaline phosphatase D
MRLYRKASFGQLAEMLVLDTRQYRTDQPNGKTMCSLNEDCYSKNATMLGPEQRDWMKSSLIASSSQWNILAQQVMMATVDRKAGTKQEYAMDKWPGYLHERNGLISFLSERKVPNPIVLTGDIHSNWANDLRIDDLKHNTPVVATEFVGTSISSAGNGVAASPRIEAILAENPGVKFHNQERGYVACEVTKKDWRSDYYVVDDVTIPSGTVSRRASYVVEAGKSGAVPA